MRIEIGVWPPQYQDSIEGHIWVARAHDGHGYKYGEKESGSLKELDQSLSLKNVSLSLEHEIFKPGRLPWCFIGEGYFDGTNCFWTISAEKKS